MLGQVEQSYCSLANQIISFVESLQTEKHNILASDSSLTIIALCQIWKLHYHRDDFDMLLSFSLLQFVNSLEFKENSFKSHSRELISGLSLNAFLMKSSPKLFFSPIRFSSVANSSISSRKSSIFAILPKSNHKYQLQYLDLFLSKLSQDWVAKRPFHSQYGEIEATCFETFSNLLSIISADIKQISDSKNQPIDGSVLEHLTKKPEWITCLCGYLFDIFESNSDTRFISPRISRRILQICRIVLVHCDPIELVTCFGVYKREQNANAESMVSHFLYLLGYYLIGRFLDGNWNSRITHTLRASKVFSILKHLRSLHLSPRWQNILNACICHSLESSDVAFEILGNAEYWSQEGLLNVSEVVSRKICLALGSFVFLQRFISSCDLGSEVQVLCGVKTTSNLFSKTGIVTNIRFGEAEVLLQPLSGNLEFAQISLDYLKVLPDRSPLLLIPLSKNALRNLLFLSISIPSPSQDRRKVRFFFAFDFKKSNEPLV